MVKAFIFLVFLYNCPMAFADSQFPLRQVYPNVNVISSETLYQNLDNSTIIDVRDKFEFDVVHILGAINLPLSNPDFISHLKRLKKQDQKQIVFYCNGHSCRKSYEAAKIAKDTGLSRHLTYDGGIYDWIKLYPDKSVLLGETPVTDNKIISEQEFLKHNLAHKDFDKLCSSHEKLVIDIRNTFDTRGFKGFSGNTIHVSADRLIPYLNEKVRNTAKLCFFDSVGKQVRWLQYYLKDMGYKDYFFLLGGAKAINTQPKGHIH